MLRRSTGRRKSPLAPLVRKFAPLLPIVAVLGLLARLLEGAGTGLFIPLLSLVLSDAVPAGIPEPIRALRIRRAEPWRLIQPGSIPPFGDGTHDISPAGIRKCRRLSQGMRVLGRPRPDPPHGRHLKGWSCRTPSIR